MSYLPPDIKTLENLREIIASKSFSAVGSSGVLGRPYHDVYFKELRTADVQRTSSQERLELIVNTIDLSGKLVFDLGCNLGFFCFGLAESGARVVGIDADKDSILVAEAIREAYRVNDVSFVNDQIDHLNLAKLVKRYGKPDVVLLNSVIHWLTYSHGSLVETLGQLRILLCDKKEQHVFYEPSSTGAAYYPELLSQHGIARFFFGLDIRDYKKIGSSWTSNSNQVRSYFYGHRDFRKLERKVTELTRAMLSEQGAHPNCRILRKNKGKLVFASENFVIKICNDQNSIVDRLLGNEATALMKFESRFASRLVANLVIDGRRTLVFERNLGATISQGWISSSDVAIIGEYIDQIIKSLRNHNLIHNDLRPDNFIWDPILKELYLIDFEYALSGVGNMEEYFLQFCNNEEQIQYIRTQLSELGGKWRSPGGPGTFDNDLYSARSTVFTIKNRKKYAIWRISSVLLSLMSRFKKTLIELLAPPPN